MPKKIRTPPPGDDEPKYLAIYKPYPLNAHWELPADCLAFARWFACCVGKDDLLKFLAFFHKPRARGIVLVEIDRSYKDFGRLLGEHAWNTFLQKPTKEEMERVTQVFYSTYPSGREAQKDGWKRINVEDDWFRNWSPKNPIVHFPYPPTTWCPVPPEDKTNKSMCRPLPQSVLPAPPKVAPPVVGSASWVAAQGGPNVKGAWGTGKPRAVARGKGPSVTIPRSEPPIITNAKSPTAKSPNNAWNKPASATTSAASDPWGSPPSNTSAASTPPGLSPLTPSSATPSPGIPESVISSVRANQHAHIQQSMDALSLTSPDDLYDIAREEGVDPAHVYMADWEVPRSLGGGSTYETAPLAASSYAPARSDITDSLWGDEETSNTSNAAEQPLLCKTHGVICKKGICRDYAKQLKDHERALAKANKGGSVNGNRNGNGRGGRDGRRGGGRQTNESTTSDGFSVVGRKNGGPPRPAPQASRSASGKSTTSNHDDDESNLWEDAPVKPTAMAAGANAVDEDDEDDDDDGW